MINHTVILLSLTLSSCAWEAHLPFPLKKPPFSRMQGEAPRLAM
jgi:hypothetical protein